jgi:hypothetical protein
VVDKAGHESTNVQNEHEIKPVFLANPVQGKSPFNHSVGYSKSFVIDLQQPLALSSKISSTLRASNMHPNRAAMPCITWHQYASIRTR